MGQTAPRHARIDSDKPIGHCHQTTYSTDPEGFWADVTLCASNPLSTQDDMAAGQWTYRGKTEQDDTCCFCVQSLSRSISRRLIGSPQWPVDQKIALRPDSSSTNSRLSTRPLSKLITVT